MYLIYFGYMQLFFIKRNTNLIKSKSSKLMLRTIMSRMLVCKTYYMIIG